MKPEEFKTWRERMGWTQKEAAEALGMSVKMIIAYEKGYQAKDRPVSIPQTVSLATEALEMRQQRKVC